MKASMMTEAALIPGIAFFRKLNPNSKCSTEFVFASTQLTVLYNISPGVRLECKSSLGYRTLASSLDRTQSKRIFVRIWWHQRPCHCRVHRQFVSVVSARPSEETGCSRSIVGEAFPSLLLGTRQEDLVSECQGNWRCSFRLLPS